MLLCVDEPIDDDHQVSHLCLMFFCIIDHFYLHHNYQSIIIDRCIPFVLTINVCHFAHSAKTFPPHCFIMIKSVYMLELYLYAMNVNLYDHDTMLYL